VSKGRTQYFGFTLIGSNDHISDDDYAFGIRDPRFNDLLHRLWETHHHTGRPRGTLDPALPPGLALDTTEGVLPSGTRVWYRFTVVDPNGFESGGSPEAFVDTSAAVAAPGAPVLVPTATGGTLPPGQYLYKLTAYQATTTEETLDSDASAVDVPTGTSTTRRTAPASCRRRTRRRRLTTSPSRFPASSC
jgi:hypothetical protein